MMYRSGTQCGNVTKGAMYKNCNVYTDETLTELFFEGTKNYNYSLTVSTTDSTNNPITVYTNYFSLEDVQNYKVYFSSDNKNFTDMHVETLTNADGTVDFRYYYAIFQNGVYYFKFLDNSSGEQKILTLTVTNIEGQQEQDKNGIPLPILQFYKTGENFIIRTQAFTLEQIKKYQCFYTQDVSSNSWTSMHIGTKSNTDLNTLEYFFYFSIPENSKDKKFFIRFYDTSQQVYGSIATIDCIISNMNDYVNKVEPSVQEGEETIEDLKEYFKERFGFLTFPFEFISDILDRIMNIDFKEPVLKIPELRDPINNYHLVDEIELNFNDFLENDTFKTIHDIYLIAVDFILIVSLLILAVKTLQEVLGRG